MGHESSAQASVPDGTARTPKDTGKPKLKRKDYEKALRKLQTELCVLQDWIKRTGQRIVKKEFIKIAETKKQKRPGMLLLQFLVLAQHRRLI